jgi:DNA-binding response OmpR family regulator
VGLSSRILIIEDHAEIRENLAEFLMMEDFEILTAENGRVGLELAQREIPDLILCDIRMPEMDGLSVLQALKADSSTAKIPFVFISSHSEQKEKSEALSLGADDMFIKPFDPEEVLGRIDEWIAVGQRR